MQIGCYGNENALKSAFFGYSNVLYWDIGFTAFYSFPLIANEKRVKFHSALPRGAAVECRSEAEGGISMS